MSEIRDTPVHDCLDDDTLAGYADGSLGAEARVLVDEHVDRCHACRRLLAAVGASADPPQLSGHEQAGGQKRQA